MMTDILINMSVPSVDGTPIAAVGILTFTPTARHVDGMSVILPKGFPVQLINGVATVTLEPTTPAWVWKIDEGIVTGSTRYVEVDASTTPVRYQDLRVLDPATLQPSGPPLVDVWIAALNAATTTATTTATTQAELAAASAAQAVITARTMTGELATATAGATTTATTAATTATTQAVEAASASSAAASAASAAASSAATAAATLGAFVPREIVATAAGQTNRVLKITSSGAGGAGNAPLEIVNKEFTGNGGWPSNILTSLGYNASEYLQDTSGDDTKPRFMLNLESGYYDGGGATGTYGPELYLDNGLGPASPAGGSVVSTFRPLYIRTILGTGVDASAAYLPFADQYTETLFNIGQGVGGSFVVTAGALGPHLLAVSQDIIQASTPQFSVINRTGPLACTLDGTTGSQVVFRCNSADSYSFTATTVNQFLLLDKNDAAVVAWQYVDPDLGVASMDVRTALRVRGLHWVHPDAGIARSALDGPSGSQVSFRVAGADSFNLLATAATQMLLNDKSGTAVAVWSYGATPTASLFDVRSSLKVGGNVGFYGTAPAAKPTISGSRGGNAALASLITGLASLGLVVDSSAA